MGREQVSPKTFTLFIKEVSKLEAIEFIGLAKILCVPILDKKGNEKNFEEILSEVLDKFLIIGRKQRKEIFKLIRIANSKRGEKA